MVSPNAGPSPFAGSRCDKKMVLLAPNYQAGRDAIEGFKREFKGEIAAEIYTKLDQSDFSIEMARIRDLKPDAIFQFHPGGLGINFAKQYAASGLNKNIPMILPVFSMDTRMLRATGDAAEGLYTVALWAPTLDVPGNAGFVKAFTEEYKRAPTHYAALGYDTANLMGTALKANGGDMNKADAFRDALRKAEFLSVRGNFAFDTNHHPIQDFYLVRFERNDKGALVHKVQGKVLEKYNDHFAPQCKMN